MVRKTKIFLDSGDPAETKAIKELLGFLDGQTTNPTLVAKNPFAKTRFEKGEKFSSTEILDFYKQLVNEVSGIIPGGSVSIEVYADPETSAEAMFKQGQEMFDWIPNAHIKYPISKAGLSAAELSVAAGLRVNMTLCFTQEQAAAVYAATRGANSGEAFVSPFIGRLDDMGQNGTDLIRNTVKMYQSGDGHVAVLAASVRNLDHFYQSLAIGADIITAPFTVLKAWGEAGAPEPPADFVYLQDGLDPISYRHIDLNRKWDEYDVTHPLTDKGIANFARDWNNLIG